MGSLEKIAALRDQYIIDGNHGGSDYFTLIKELIKLGDEGDGKLGIQGEVDSVYTLIRDEFQTNTADPENVISFGTSGWRGILGKDVYVRTVGCVTQAIADMYSSADSRMLDILGVQSLQQARERGCVIGHDNRFGGPLFGRVAAKVLTDNGFRVYFAGEATTGALSAAILVTGAAFSINLTPSHNPLEYGGFKYNAADAGPAAPELTTRITELARKLINTGYQCPAYISGEGDMEELQGLESLDALGCWKELVRKNVTIHKVDYDEIVKRFAVEKRIVVAIDSVHGASRKDIRALFDNYSGSRLLQLRDNDDPTFGGIAPEPSSVNIRSVKETLSKRTEDLKVGAIIDPDADRIRFTDGDVEISMNQFGAMVYHFLHNYRGLRGMVAKTVASSNLANAVAKGLGQEVFEPKVGFKEFKPVMGKAIVFFEESDGISIIGHTPEKDAYIGLMLALDMVLTTGKNLGDYLSEIEGEFGEFHPDRDGLVVQLKGDELIQRLQLLEKYAVGKSVMVGGEDKIIKEIIDIDGRKMIFEDDSWLMIRPSGTEPKVRFYVESRTSEGTGLLVETAKNMLRELGLV